ncbi:aminomethyltransferase family protein [Lactococcus allomyrinae]|uniref:Aminomethyl transferase family protein n=1 Tax=Lactococcus allomyrinae TaxID=2419773 RepID=A0A387BIR8_9LACT|nr:aminomethyltransferase family protein [Lactococcus allomyrinae]AYG02064.1 aminomethyl transferase family protein [Lactococcus allomyrinae]
MKDVYKELRTNKSFKQFEGKIFEVSGDDAEVVLDQYIPKNIEFLDIDTCGFTFILTTKGTVFTEVVFYKLEDKYILLSKENLLTIFENKKFDFQIKDISDEKVLFQLEGKNSGEIAQRFYDYDISTLNFKGIIYSEFENTELIVARFGFSGEFGYQFLVEKNKGTDFISQYFHNISEYDEYLNDYVKFEVNHPIYDLYKQDSNLFELGYAWNLDFTKESFIGRAEILNKIEKAKVQSIVFSSLEKVKAGEKIYFDDKEIGTVHFVMDALDEQENREYLGMLMVEPYYAHSGIHFITENNVELETISNPYIIPESWSK